MGGEPKFAAHKFRLPRPPASRDWFLEAPDNRGLNEPFALSVHPGFFTARRRKAQAV